MLKYVHVVYPSLLMPVHRHVQVAHPSLPEPSLQFEYKQTPELIKWDPPPPGFIKINTHASVKNNGKAGFGGIFRDMRGLWVKGFCGYLGTKIQHGNTSVLKAELLAILAALKIARSMCLKFVIIESDCKVAVDMIEIKDINKSRSCEVKSIVQECRELLFSGCCYTISHKKREGNFCADKMAKLGVECEVDLRVFNCPPVQVLPFMKADLLGVAYPRGTKL